jgi:hypothetical protein
MLYKTVSSHRRELPSAMAPSGLALQSLANEAAAFRGNIRAVAFDAFPVLDPRPVFALPVQRHLAEMFVTLPRQGVVRNDSVGAATKNACRYDLVLYRGRSGGESFRYAGIMNAGAFSIQLLKEAVLEWSCYGF